MKELRKILITLALISFSNSIIAQNDKYKDVINKLLVVYESDQNLRIQSDSIENKYGLQSTQVRELWKQIYQNDSINLITVKTIIDKYGWLGSDDIGLKGNSTLFLVIQHSDLKTQEYYLSFLREAVKTRKANPSHLALLEDRVALRQGKRQIYGSQIGQDETSLKDYVLPLLDARNVDIRRAKVGLQPIAEYLLNFGIVWDVEIYVKEVDELEARLREKRK